MGNDEFDNSTDSVRDGCGFEIEVMRAGDRNVGDGAIDFEELQAERGELLAEDRGDLERKPTLFFPALANEPA